MTHAEDLDLREHDDGTLSGCATPTPPRPHGHPLPRRPAPHVPYRIINAAADAARHDAEAAATRARGEHDQADVHAGKAEHNRRMSDLYRGYAEIDAAQVEAYEAWTRVTQGTLHIGVLADALLRQRHPRAELPALATAEPEAPDPELTRLPDEAELAELAAAENSRQAEFRERLEARQGVRIPHPDHEMEDQGEAWPSPYEPWGRDAILKPPRRTETRRRTPAPGRCPSRGRGMTPGPGQEGTTMRPDTRWTRRAVALLTQNEVRTALHDYGHERMTLLDVMIQAALKDPRLPLPETPPGMSSSAECSKTPNNDSGARSTPLAHADCPQARHPTPPPGQFETPTRPPPSP